MATFGDFSENIDMFTTSSLASLDYVLNCYCSSPGSMLSVEWTMDTINKCLFIVC